MNGFQIGSKRLKVQHKRVGGPGMPGMGKEQDNHFPRNMMMHNLATLNPMMGKMGGHELGPGLPPYNNQRFEYGNPNMLPQFQMIPANLGPNRGQYQQQLPDMESFNLQEYMPSNGGVKHL
jgi:hypothetical protein